MLVSIHYLIIGLDVFQLMGLYEEGGIHLLIIGLDFLIARPSCGSQHLSFDYSLDIVNCLDIELW